MTDWIAKEAVETPQLWDKGGRTHNWRNYITEELKAMWETFTAKQKIAIAQMADEIADREHWD